MRPPVAIACLCAFLGLGSVTPAAGQQNPYRLKDTDEKKICLACHTDFEQTLKKASVHTPVKAGECSGCHDPHVASHAKLLPRKKGEICLECHEAVVSAKARSRHKAVAEGACEKCHDPHASDNPNNLIGRGNDLCVGCHKELGESIKNAKFRHGPVERGCLTCHSAHGSEQAQHLLKSAEPSLCLGCHKPGTPAFQARHQNYPVAKATCTSCHDPHGSNRPALLLNVVHQPVSAASCSRCHEAPTSPNPFATKQAGFELCRGCHSETVSGMFSKAHLHWPVAQKQGCISCHNPHASRYPKLARAEGANLCRDCHSDTVDRINTIAVRHAPVAEGSCASCHSPHASDAVHLITQPTMNAVCSACHDYQTHSAHPIGEKAVDPRNKNLRVDCLSCHKGHGTPFKRMLLAETTSELCTRCHKKYAR